MQRGAGAPHPALDCSDRAMADARRVVVGQTMHDHQDQCISLRGWNSPYRSIQIPKDKRIDLIRRDLTRSGFDNLRRRNDRALASIIGDGLVVHDGEDPGLEVGAWLELVGRYERANNCILDEIIRKIIPPAEETREGTHVGQTSGKFRNESV